MFTLVQSASRDVGLRRCDPSGQVRSHVDEIGSIPTGERVGFPPLANGDWCMPIHGHGKRIVPMMVSCPQCGSPTPRAGYAIYKWLIAIFLFPFGLLIFRTARNPTQCVKCSTSWVA
jgi:hypothetical protein